MTLSANDITEAIAAFGARVSEARDLAPIGVCAHALFPEVDADHMVEVQKAGVAELAAALNGGASPDMLEYVAIHVLAIVQAYGYMFGRLDERSENTSDIPESPTSD